MTHYVGIDLGTTNSAICSYDGEAAVLYKSPEQHDVTPSAIFIDRRGNKHVGARAYNNAARNPDNAATLFKRLMGTSTPVRLPAVDLVLTPEECSAEILKVLFGYLPESIRNDADTGTVITVPAAFNQMQKDATMEAAGAAGLGRVALMQEPVAAVMSVMRKRRADGIFLVYDLGGGTLDVAIAESIASRVNLLAHGGIAMCGGRDFDRLVFDSVVRPWLAQSFDLPEDLESDPAFRTLVRVGTWAAERAKIELSAREEAVITASESEVAARARDGAEVYLDIPLTRDRLDELIAGRVADSIASARETIEKAGLGPHDVERVVFVGGPTQYKPLRDRIARELGIAPSTDVNPMTAVAEGAALFAESIDWSSVRRGRKSARGSISQRGAVDISIDYVSRTPELKAKMAIKVGGAVRPGASFQVDSLDTGWSSGRMDLKDGVVVEVALAKAGDNTFKVFVLDPDGGPMALAEDRIVITRTAASIDAIPASHSIGLEVRDRIGGRLVLDHLVREGEQLPKKGRRTYKAEESLRAGAAGSLKFKLWEGEIESPISDNRFIGLFEITGTDIEDGVVSAGADLICDYEVGDSGNIVIDVSVPSIRGTFHSGRNFYSRKEAGVDYTNASKRILQDAQKAIDRLNDIESRVSDPLLGTARERLSRASAIRVGETNPESAKEAMDDIQEAKKLIAKARKANLRIMRQMELDRIKASFDEHVRRFARPTEEVSYDNLFKAAQRSIEGGGPDFEAQSSQLKAKAFMILWRQDWFVADRFRWYMEAPHLFADATHHAELVASGQRALAANDVEQLRKTVAELDLNRIASPDEDQLVAGTNIVRG